MWFIWHEHHAQHQKTWKMKVQEVQLSPKVKWNIWNHSSPCRISKKHGPQIMQIMLVFIEIYIREVIVLNYDKEQEPYTRWKPHMKVKITSVDSILCMPWHRWLAVSLSLELWVQSQAHSSGICGKQSGSGAGFSLTALFCSVTVIPPMFLTLSIHLSLILYNLGSWKNLAITQWVSEWVSEWTS